MISVIIPAARSQEVTQFLVNWLRVYSIGDDPDIIVSSPTFAVNGATCVRDDFMGSAAAIGAALPHVNPKSNYVAWLSDECLPTSGCLETMAAFLDTHPPPFIGEFSVGDAGCLAVDKRYARWGMTTRATIDMIGFFDIGFGSFFGDVDFSLRCWAAGGAVAICQNSKILHKAREDGVKSGNTERHYAHDQALYLSRWPNN